VTDPVIAADEAVSTEETDDRYDETAGPNVPVTALPLALLPAEMVPDALLTTEALATADVGTTAPVAYVADGVAVIHTVSVTT
jgi:hypothetical protein